MKYKSQPLLVREAKQSEWNEAMILTWATFVKYNSEDYTDRGIESFREFISNEKMYKMFLCGHYIMFLALKDEMVVGVITLRNKNHISLLFIKEGYHGQGIGRKLVEEIKGYVKKTNEKEQITVNSSPYAIKFYHTIGFFDKGLEQENDGIQYVPMEIYL